MVTVFFYIRCAVHFEFLPTGQTVNKEYYLDVMRRLREVARFIKEARIVERQLVLRMRSFDRSSMPTKI